MNISSLLGEGITPAKIVAAVVKALDANPGQVGLASFSHITSVPGLIFPVKQLIDECHKRGVLVLIDGAHAPGQIKINVEELGADFYVGDLHKVISHRSSRLAVS